MAEGVIGSVYAGFGTRLYREGIRFSDIKGLCLAVCAGSAVRVIGKGDVDRLGRGIDPLGVEGLALAAANYDQIADIIGRSFAVRIGVPVAELFIFRWSEAFYPLSFEDDFGRAAFSGFFVNVICTRAAVGIVDKRG